MQGNLNDFQKKVSETTKGILASYTPEIEFALGPAKVTLRAAPSKSNAKEVEEAENAR